MNQIIGPRIVYYIANDGSHRPITITIEIGERDAVTLPGGDVVINHVGYYHIKADWLERSMRLLGQDDLQLIYRCLWLSDLWLRQVCEEAGVELFAIIPDDVKKPLDLFS